MRGHRFGRSWCFLSVMCLTASGVCEESGVQGYYRFPALHGETIAFVAEGDLWTVSHTGGTARRLTSHAAEETNPRISPDGRTIAFAAHYEGPTEVYTMPLSGGAPVRRTVEAEPSIPIGWTRGGKLIYSTEHYSTLPEKQLVIADLATGRRQRVPLSQASDAAMGPDGTIFFTRPRFHRQSVKRYQGGTARNIWVFQPQTEEAVNLTSNTPRECHSPMVAGDRVYFATDRDGTMNIWSMSISGDDLTQHTHHSGFDVKTPSVGGHRIVYQLGADIWLLDIESGVHQVIPITLASDLDQLREKWITKPAEELTSAHIHPKGESVVLTSRGRIFVAPTKHGRLVRASRKAGVRFRDACFLPDGESILTLSDESGEFEFWKLSARGIGEPLQVTSDGTTLRWRGHPSPDGKHVAHADKDNDLWLVNLEDRTRQKVSQGREGIFDLRWSPDSRWISFSEFARNTYIQVHLYGLEQRKTTTLTSNRINSFSPAWSPDGEWLYFLSDRSLVSAVPSPWGPRQPEPYFDKPMKIYRLALKEGLRSPFKPRDELQALNQESKKDVAKERRDERDDEKSASGDKQETNKPVTVEVELDGIQRRVKPVPVPAGNISRLEVNDKALFWLEGKRPGRNVRRRLMALEVGQDKKPQEVADDIRYFELSLDGKSLMARRRSSLFVFGAAPKSADLSETRVDLRQWRYSIDVREDWRQIFGDAWRLHRDYFYDPNMHGVNWAAVRDKYAPFVERVTTRSELSDVIGQMVGELSTLHTAVRGGDHRQGPDKITVPTFGARLQRDEHAGGYRIDYIYRSDPDYPEELSPLADPDLNIQVGDVIQAINGEPVLAHADPHFLLRNQHDQQVLLRVRSESEETSREHVITPIANEAALRYRDWEYSRRERVEKEGAGNIGYVHLRAMGSSNLTEWYRNFYPVFDRQGLIIDVRHNRGGNIDSIILEKLLRRAWFYWKGRVGVPTWNMQYAFRGHMVVLCDEHTASDGEAFTEGFRRLGLGKVIGTRTWGGEIWLTASNLLSDGGIATAAEMGVYGPQRKWLIEGHGVDPDITVDNRPHATFNGQDAQLDAAIDHLLQAIKSDPRPVPDPPAYPDKSFDYP
jgi:tricorn protease